MPVLTKDLYERVGQALGSLPIVVADQATEDFPMADEALRWTGPVGNRRLLLKALVRSSTVVIVDVFSQNTVQRPAD